MERVMSREERIREHGERESIELFRWGLSIMLLTVFGSFLYVVPAEIALQAWAIIIIMGFLLVPMSMIVGLVLDLRDGRLSGHTLRRSDWPCRGSYRFEDPLKDHRYESSPRSP